jgi:hypothetical protein
MKISNFYATIGNTSQDVVYEQIALVSRLNEKLTDDAECNLLPGKKVS